VHADVPHHCCRGLLIVLCHTRFSEGNQVQAYMHVRIKFHAYSDIKVNTETVSRKKTKDYQRFTLTPGGCVRLAPATSS
jgi:predicted secreted protein